MVETFFMSYNEIVGEIVFSALAAPLEKKR
jgi:hypothetical protein